MTVTVRIYAFTESHVTEAKPVAVDLEVEWRDGEIDHAWLTCGERANARVDSNVAHALLGGREAAESLIRGEIEAERLAS